MPYTIHKAQDGDGRTSRFCSAACRDNGLSIERIGENNPMWDGGHTDNYGSNWHRQKRKARRRDSHTCQVCGYKFDGSVILDVHHITKAKTFNGNWRLANALSNLISLCRPCHVKVESGKIPCPPPTAN